MTESLLICHAIKRRLWHIFDGFSMPVMFARDHNVQIPEQPNTNGHREQDLDLDSIVFVAAWLWEHMLCVCFATDIMKWTIPESLRPRIRAPATFVPPNLELQSETPRAGIPIWQASRLHHCFPHCWVCSCCCEVYAKMSWLCRCGFHQRCHWRFSCR